MRTVPRAPVRARGEPAQRRVTALTVVVPAKNESATIGELVLRIRRVLERLDGLRYEVLVVDDGSTDGTGAVASEAGARVVRHERSLGNGAAIKRGIRNARLDWVLMMDADGQHPPEVLPQLIAAAERADMVVASREGAGGAWHRNFANRCYNRLASYVTGRRIPDLTSGFRILRADVARRLVYLLPNTFSYPTTITLAMLRSGFDVDFVPFAVRRREGKSHIRLLQDGSRFFLIILKIATFFAPLKVFLPLAFATFLLGVGWYGYTYLVFGRFTNMAALLISQASIVFVLGLVSEQVAALRFERFEQRGDE
ncbi:MAG: glycosyltransferase family 2 protein [Planctomycetes bacterium]|nr:glycosyltransferase family 2 protein [Planctomycetota bacterium]